VQSPVLHGMDLEWRSRKEWRNARDDARRGLEHKNQSGLAKRDDNGLGRTETCFNWTTPYPLIGGNLTGLHQRYYYIIDTWGYVGLTVGSYTATSEQVYYDILNGRVPDPIAGRCLFGYLTGSLCDGTCTGSGMWDAFRPSVSSADFRARKLVWTTENVWPFRSCYQFVPMSEPSGERCGEACFVSKGVICPVTQTVTTRTCNGNNGPYYYSGPVYGNFFWRFNNN
jgi:hypothetical protein